MSNPSPVSAQKRSRTSTSITAQQASCLADPLTLVPQQWHYGPDTRVAVSRDNKLAGSINLDGSVHLWSLSTGELLARVAINKPLSDITWGQNNSLWVVSCDGHAYWVDYQTGAYSLVGDTGENARIQSLPDGSVVVGDQQRILLIPPNKNTALWQHPVSSAVSDITFHPTTQDLYAVHKNSTISVIDHNTGRLIHSTRLEHRAIVSIAISPNGQLLAVGDEDGWVSLLSVPNYSTIMRKKVHDAEVLSLCFSSDNSRLASSSADRSIRIYSTTKARVLKTITGFSSCVHDISATSDDSFLVAGVCDGSVQRVTWQGKILPPVASYFRCIRAISIRHDGQVLATTGDEKVLLWDLERGADPRSFDLNNLGRQLAFHPSLDRLAVIDRFGELSVWDTRTLRCIQRFETESTGQTLRWATDGATLVYDCHQSLEVRNVNSGVVLGSISAQQEKRYPMLVFGHKGLTAKLHYNAELSLFHPVSRQQLRVAAVADFDKSIPLAWAPDAHYLLDPRYHSVLRFRQQHSLTSPLLTVDDLPSLYSASLVRDFLKSTLSRQCYRSSEGPARQHIGDDTFEAHYGIHATSEEGARVVLTEQLKKAILSADSLGTCVRFRPDHICLIPQTGNSDLGDNRDLASHTLSLARAIVAAMLPTP